MGYISTCVSHLKEPKYLERCPLIVETRSSNNDDAVESNIREAIIIEVNGTYFYVTEFLKVLYNLAVNDEIKHDIYAKFDMRRLLAELVASGNSTEREYALKLLCQLCFDRRVADDVSCNQPEILAVLKQLKDLKVSDENKNLIKCSNGIFWLLDNQKNEGVSSELNSVQLLSLRKRNIEEACIGHPKTKRTAASNHDKLQLEVERSLFKNKE